MPPTPAQIKDKLTNALDDDKNVIDEKAVEEVIALLEASVITKEILEQTRLGRDINLVRKNSKNPIIAKRAKNLVKAWQKLIEDPGSPRVLNGQHPHARVSPGLSPAPVRNLTPKASLQSPALLQAKQLQASRLAGTLSPATSAAAKLSHGRPTPKTGKLKHSGKASPALRGQPQNDDSNISWAASSPSNLSESSQDRLLGDRENQEAKGTKNCQPGTSKRNFRFDTKPLDHSTGVTSKSENRASDQRDVSKTNVANRKRTRSSVLEDSNDSLSSELPPSKQTRLVSPSQSLSASHKNNVINGSFVRKAGTVPKSAGAGDGLTPDSTAVVLSPMLSSTAKGSNSHDHVDSSVNQRLQLPPLRQDSVDSRASCKAGKVKTTEQLIEDMQKKAASTGDMNVIAQIRTNLLQKEADAQKAAAVPNNDRGGKKRGRKKKNASVSQQLELPGSDAASDTRKLAQAKSEYIERFLQTSVAPTPGEDAFEHSRQESLEEPHHPISLGGCSNSFIQSAYDSGFPAYPSRQDKPDSGPSASPPDARDILEAPTCALRDNSTSSVENLSVRQLLAGLPPIDPESIDWTLHDYPAPEPKAPTVDRVEELHQRELHSVNGTYDRDGIFKGWHEMLTANSIYDEPLHILPYVLPND